MFRTESASFSLSLTNHAGEWVMSWPGWATDGVLEEASGLEPSPAWTPVSFGLYEVDSATWNMAYRVRPLTGSRFYRVRRVEPAVGGMTSYWRLDQESGLPAPSAQGTVLLTTNTAWVAGRVGSGALRFNGQPASAGGSAAWFSNAGYQVLPPPREPFTLSLWFRPEILTQGSRALLGSADSGSNRWQVALSTSGPGTNALILEGMQGAASLSVTGRVLLLPGQWHRLTITSTTNQTSLFLDAKLLAHASGPLPAHDGLFFLGGGVDGLNSFAGRLDDIRIYRQALTPAEVALTGEWRFDENLGGLAADSSPQGHAARVTATDGWVPGRSGMAIDLSRGPVMIPNEDLAVLPALGRPFSVSLWLQPGALPPGTNGLLYCAEDAARGWEVTVETPESGAPWLAFTSTNHSGTLALRAPVPLTNGVWTRLDLNYSGGAAAVFANGRQIASDYGAIRPSTAPLLVGAVPGMANFQGLLDDLRIFGRDREPAEIGPVALPVWEMALQNTTTNLVLQGAGPFGRPLTYSILSGSGPRRGTLDYRPDSPVVTYQAGGQKGPDSFVYTVSDGEFVSAPATAAVSVVQAHWLSPEGGSAQTWDGSSPERAWAGGSANALDAIWRTNNYYDCFFYAPGEYQTRGWRYWERSTANPGCKHIGSGREGQEATVLKLVDTWSAWSEGAIFANLHEYNFSDDFEVHNLVLDCNGDHNPKHVLGEPIYLRVPLASTSRVESVTLRWGKASFTGNGPLFIGPPAEFGLAAGTGSSPGSETNFLTYPTTNLVDTVLVGQETDELLLRLSRRAPGIDFYGLAEMELSGGIVSLPIAEIPGGGRSRLDAQHDVLMVADGDGGTSWASGPESQVQLTIPLAPQTVVTRLDLHWNCQTLPGIGWLGPASSYLVFARDELTGQLAAVPFVSEGRAARGLETATFGTTGSPLTVTTDQIVILLTAREAGVDHYSLRGVSLQNGPYPVPLRVPTATSTLAWDGNRSVLKVFDQDTNSAWANGTQGALIAIDVQGSNLKFTGLKVVGFSTRAGRECFPLAVFVPSPSSAHPEPFRNVLVEDCLFTQPATNNTDGLSAVSVAGPGRHSLHNAVIRRCSVVGVRSQFRYSHGFGGPLIEDCLVDDCQVAVYFEPEPSGAALDSIGEVVVRRNQFVNVDQGVYLLLHPGSHFDSLTIADNEMVLTGTGSPAFGIGACDVCGVGVSGTITNLVAMNNTIRYPGWATRPTSPDGGLASGDIQNAVYGDNLIALGTASSLRVRQYPAGYIPGKSTPEDCDHPGIIPPGPWSYPTSLDLLPPGYRRAWFNNRNLSGGLLTVRHAFWGADRLAAQQQWQD